MEQKFLMDTNIIIDAFGHTMPDNAKRYISRLLPIVSAVTYIETLGWHKATPPQLAPLYEFMNAAVILPIDKNIVEKTVVIRQQQKIGLGDAIIAATAIIHDLILLTRNINDFKNVNDLKVVNPWEQND